jgi:histone-lysine N-methyltransferase SETD7
VNGRRVGYAWELKAGGGAVVGRVDPDDGQISGHDVVYVYPDNYTLLVGNFSKGVLVTARAAVLHSVR